MPGMRKGGKPYARAREKGALPQPSAESAGFLVRMHYEVTEAATPEELKGLTLEKGRGIHQIVGDPVLSLRDGVSPLLEVSTQFGGVPILLVTSRRLDDESQGWLESMGIQWLRKRFSRDELLRKVGTILTGS